MRSRRLAAALAVAATLGGCRTCGGPPAVPKGPPPEYEEPPTPGWLDAGAPTPAPAPAVTPDAG